MNKRALFILSFFTITCSLAQNLKFGKISQEEVAQTQHPNDPSADATILYREIKTEFQYSQNSGWYAITNYYERIKIYSKEGIKWANATINQYKGRGEDKSSWISMHSQLPAIQNTLISLELQPSLDLSGKSQNRFTGNYTLDFREGFRNADPVSQQNKINKIYKNLDISDFKFQNLNQQGEPVVLEFNFDSEHAEEVAEKIVLIRI